MNKAPEEKFHEAPNPKKYAKTYNRIKKTADFLFGLNIVGAENLPEDGSYILAPSHRHIIDPFYAGIIPERAVYFMAKKELWRPYWFGAGRWMEGLGAFPVDRENPGSEPIRISRSIISNGQILGVFGEGTSKNRGEELGELKGGIGSLAVWAAKEGITCPVIPVGIDSEHLRLRNGLYMVVGKPLTLELNSRRPNKEVRDEFTKKIGFEVQQAFTQAQKNRHENLSQVTS